MHNAGAIPLIEPVPVEDDLVFGLSHIEDLGWGGRLVFYTTQSCFESGEDVYVVKRKIVMPRDTLCRGRPVVTSFLCGRPMRLVR